MTNEREVLPFCLVAGYYTAIVITTRHKGSTICWHAITLRPPFCLVLYKTKWPRWWIDL